MSEDKSIFDLFTADYTFVNERLAKHYGMVGVTGPEHRLVQYQDPNRRGIFAHGSMLTLTSHPYRTSAVLRGKWVRRCCSEARHRRRHRMSRTSMRPRRRRTAAS